MPDFMGREKERERETERSNGPAPAHGAGEEIVRAARGHWRGPPSYGATISVSADE